jgi:hypothetical protein
VVTRVRLIFCYHWPDEIDQVSDWLGDHINKLGVGLLLCGDCHFSGMKIMKIFLCKSITTGDTVQIDVEFYEVELAKRINAMNFFSSKPPSKQDDDWGEKSNSN